MKQKGIEPSAEMKLYRYIYVLLMQYDIYKEQLLGLLRLAF